MNWVLWHHRNFYVKDIANKDRLRNCGFIKIRIINVSVTTTWHRSCFYCEKCRTFSGIRVLAFFGGFTNWQPAAKRVSQLRRGVLTGSQSKLRSIRRYLDYLEPSFCGGLWLAVLGLPTSAGEGVLPAWLTRSVWLASERGGWGQKTSQDLAQPLLHSSRQLLCGRCERATPLNQLIVQRGGRHSRVN